MSINLNQLVQGALTESVLQHLAARVGCTQESARRVVGLCAPALIGSMMNKAASLDGARSLFASVMSPGVNTHIAEELPHFVLNDEGMQTLLATHSTVDGVIASHDNLNALAERISEYTGVAASASRTLSGVVGATILGILKRYFTQHNGHIGQLPTLLGHQLPVVRANMTDSFANALGLGSVGAFLAGVASRLKAVSSHLGHPATQEAASFPIHGEQEPAVETAQTNDKGPRRKWLWVANAAALALLAALVARGCSTENKSKDVTAETRTDASAASDAASASSASASDDQASQATAVAPDQASLPTILPGKDASLSMTVDASGIPTLKATVNSEQERQRLIDMLSAKLGADKFHANVTVDPDTKPAAWLDKLEGLLPLMTLPGADLQITGDTITLSGGASEPKLGWVDKLKALFGAGWTVGTQSAPVAAPASEAQANQDADACSAPAIVKTLNLKPVNFGTGSNTPPPVAMAALAASAKALKACDTQAKPIQLQIAGYSDNTGGAALNLQLSKKRAEAVRSYLVQHGIPSDSLTAQGFGDANPVADNSTAAGRMANRRIEFKQAD
ncbi:OmpA family protein [Caballeronia sp. HLA56]